MYSKELLEKVLIETCDKDPLKTAYENALTQACKGRAALELCYRAYGVERYFKDHSEFLAERNRLERFMTLREWQFLLSHSGNSNLAEQCARRIKDLTVALLLANDLIPVKMRYHGESDPLSFIDGQVYNLIG